MGKKLIQSRTLADGSVICRSTKYADREDLPSGPDKAAVIVGLAECQATPAIPEYSRSFQSITGRYEGQMCTVCINQAGYHVTLWISEIPSHRGANRPVTRYAGNYDSASGRFDLYDPDAPGTIVGHLTHDGLNPPHLEITDWIDEPIRRFSGRATLSDRALQALTLSRFAKKHSVAAGFLENEHAPLAPSHYQELWEHLTGREFETQLQTLFKLVPASGMPKGIFEQGTKDLIRRQIERINKDINDIVDKRIKPVDHKRLQWHVRDVLTGRTLTLLAPSGTAQTFTLYEWLQRVVYYGENYTAAPPDMSAITRGLGIPHSDEFRYELEVDLEGWAVSSGIPFGSQLKKHVEKQMKRLPEAVRKIFEEQFIKRAEKLVEANGGGKMLTGTLTIRSQDTTDPWEEVYVLHFSQVGLSTKGGARFGEAKFKGKGWTTTKVEWRPNDFVGPVTILPGWGFFDDDRPITDPTIMIIAEGSGTSEGTIMTLDDIQLDTSPHNLAGFGWGAIELDKPIKDPPMRRGEVIEVKTGHNDNEAINFRLSSATILDEGRQALRAFAANELAALRDPDSVLKIVGFADRLGRRWYNDELSKSRARNTLQALRDCTDGEAIKAQIELGWHGERLLELLDRFFDFPDNSPRPEWRRVFAMLNMTVALNLWVRDPKDV
jgi:hypothetical protein